jgi:hypothetical protein
VSDELNRLLRDPEALDRATRLVSAAIGENDQAFVDQFGEITTGWLLASDDQGEIADKIMRLTAGFAMLTSDACKQFAILVESAKVSQDPDETVDAADLDETAVRQTALYFLNLVRDNVGEQPG